MDTFSHKVIVLRLFLKCLTDEALRSHYSALLSSNFSKLDRQAIYDFVFNDWIVLSLEEINTFLSGILELNQNKAKGVYSYPDPIEEKMECVYLLYINDIITDIRVLRCLAEDRPHLHFLLNPDTFDYTQVDFSNYMWENFARHEKYMSYFISHRESIIPSIKEKIRNDAASEVEKKVLYGFLLNVNEVWDK